jgi:hypothetical protein
MQLTVTPTALPRSSRTRAKDAEACHNMAIRDQIYRKASFLATVCKGEKNSLNRDLKPLMHTDAAR